MFDKNEFKKYATKHMGLSSMHMEHYIESSLTPYIIEERSLNMTQMDVFSRLMMDRIIFLGTGIDDYVANIINAQLLFLESVDSKKDIQIYLNSPGGSVYAGLGIYDTMQYVKSPVSTICIGQAASMGSFLLAAGEKGHRFSLPNARIMVHQPSAGFQGQATDIQIHANEISYVKKRLNEIYAKHTGKDIKSIQEALERDKFMSPEEAKDFGIIDKVVEKKAD